MTFTHRNATSMYHKLLTQQIITQNDKSGTKYKVSIYTSLTRGKMILLWIYTYIDVYHLCHCKKERQCPYLLLVAGFSSKLAGLHPSWVIHFIDWGIESSS